MGAGGADILGRLETGGFHWDEYDDVVAHPDFVDGLHKVRKILRNRLPTVKNGESRVIVCQHLFWVITESDCISTFVPHFNDNLKPEYSFMPFTPLSNFYVVPVK